MQRPTRTLAVMLAGAALMIGAAIAWAATPPARGGHAIAVVPSPIEITHGGRVGPIPADPIITTGAGLVAPGVPAAPETGTPFIPDARPTPSFTLAQTGSTVILDASAPPCHNGGCDFSWRAYGPSTNRLGMTVGFGAHVSFTAPSAGTWTIVLTESEYCAPGGGASLRSCPGVAQQTITVA